MIGEKFFSMGQNGVADILGSVSREFDANVDDESLLDFVDTGLVVPGIEGGDDIGSLGMGKPGSPGVEASSFRERGKGGTYAPRTGMVITDSIDLSWNAFQLLARSA